MPQAYKACDYPHEYRIWKTMLDECYCIRKLKKETNMSKHVSEEFQSFDNFLEWILTQNYTYNTDLEFNIDIRGSKTYSKDSILIIPAQVGISSRMGLKQTLKARKWKVWLGEWNYYETKEEAITQWRNWVKQFNIPKHVKKEVLQFIG